MMYNFIALEGNIGAGKTTLSRKLSEEFKGKLVLEQFEDNPFLPKFYEDPDKHAFPLELSFLAERYQQIKDEIANQDLFSSFTISDYIIDKSLIFAKINLGEDEYSLYSKLFSIIIPLIPKPDLLVYLYLDVESTLANIKSRGRDYEQKIEADYLKNVQQGYFDYLKQMQDQRILIIDLRGVDFVGDPKAYEGIVKALNSPYEKGIHRLAFSDNGVFELEATAALPISWQI
ncbi:MAG: deoxynucleoside kinase [Flavobacteriales bacterium]|nr:MAG: deoxynucleoside kinase [Flavobacteriales bacterium]